MVTGRDKVGDSLYIPRLRIGHGKKEGGVICTSMLNVLCDMNEARERISCNRKLTALVTSIRKHYTNILNSYEAIDEIMIEICPGSKCSNVMLMK